VSLSKNSSLSAWLADLPEATAYCVAYSGGVDSHALLHVLASHRESLFAPLSAVHVNHQIQSQAGDCAVHCQAVCEELQIPFVTLHVDGRARQGESPEAAARTARYLALADWLPAGALLITAQHQDDQAETLLLQLFRGAGPRGLAAMPKLTGLGQGQLLRPLLGYRQADILDYAHEHELRWVEDPTNTDTRYDRNLLRQRLLPQLREHWPGLTQVLARAAGLQADQAELAAALAELDLAACGSSDQPGQLSIPDLLKLNPARQRNLLRHWIELNGFKLPSLKVLQRIESEVLRSREDATPLIQWSGVELRRYRQALYLMAPLEQPDPAESLPWDGLQPLKLANGTLTTVPVAGSGLRIAPGALLEVGFRKGGETLQPAGRAGHHTLKKLFQEWSVPDWERSHVPLIYQHHKLVAVAGLCVCEGFSTAHNEPGYQLCWSRLKTKKTGEGDACGT
jgi:tRNA(Ile)-lysidine synthase